MTAILGISAFYHDSAAALLVDGEIVAAAQEERFTRIKGDSGFPTQAIGFCLERAGLQTRDLAFVVFYERPLLKFERLMESYLAVAPDGFASFRPAAAAWASQRLRLPEHLLAGPLETFRGDLCFAEHHQSHAASAFFPSPFGEAAILTLDAVGEWATSSIGAGSGHRITLSNEQRFPHSLGMLYSAFTHYAGFKVNSGEYKLMGLAPYGQPRYTEVILDRVAHLHDDGSVWLDMSYFDYCRGTTMTSEKFHALFGGPPRQPDAFITQKEMDIAASIQAVCEMAVLRAARYAQQLTGLRNLVMAGGVALNCVANGKLRREGVFDDIWVQPAAGDAGGALGAALLVWHHLLDRERVASSGDSQQGSFLGPSYDNETIGLFLDSVGAVYERYDDEACLLDRVTELLETEHTIGWFNGRMEFGPRSLGARSILGDPRSPRMQQTMNLKVKFRESFRPFAPCVLQEHVHEVFDVPPGDESPYMLFVSPVLESMRTPLSAEDQERMQSPDLRVRVSVPRSRVPAITHVDYSARVQTVDAERHGRFHRLLSRFHEKTGCPVLVNTSFNIRGEPIVCTPEDAYRCFLSTHIDCLVLEDHVLLKAAQSPGTLADAALYKAVYPPD